VRQVIKPDQGNVMAKMRRLPCFEFAVLLVLAAQPGAESLASGQAVAKMTVNAGKHARTDTPVSVGLDGTSDYSDAALVLEEIKDSCRIPVPLQIERGGEGRLWWILSGKTEAGTERAYELVNISAVDDSAFGKAVENGRLANEGFRRCQKYVTGWLGHADPKTGLVPKKITAPNDQLCWNAQDSAADNYPFMVLTAAMIDRTLLEGRMLDMLRTETKLTSRVGALPDTYVFSKSGFRYAEPEMGRIMFGASEYVKDGLLAITEWLGASPWSERMIGIIDEMWKNAPVETAYGKIISEDVEINGEMLQALSRVYWMTGDKKYLDWAIRLGDYYLLGGHHPTTDMERLKLRDHGCEIVSGLCELYAAVQSALPQKKLAYREPIHHMLDRILEVGRNKHGLFCSAVNPKTGEILSARIADTWGYTLNGYYTVYLVDGTQSYRQAVLKALGNLNEHYKSYEWGKKDVLADEYADSIEGAINLYNRERIRSVEDWLDSEIKLMWAMQKPNGIIEGWHGDGNFARTTLMYCLWKTKGVTIRPWRQDVVFGAEQDGEELKITIVASKPWKGKILFDAPRHKVNMKMPLDWPRINQWPEWFTVKEQDSYCVRNLTTGSRILAAGKKLVQGLEVDLQEGTAQHLLVAPVSRVVVNRNESFLELEANNEKILRYNHATVPPPAGEDPLYTRSAFIHPAWSPKGTVLTRIHPQDHVHHMGIWMPWTETEFEGRKIDFWNLKKGEGTVRFAGFGPIESGTVYAQFIAEHEHVELNAPEGEKVVLEETWDVRVYDVGGRDKGYRFWDFVSTQRCATKSPLHLLKYRYGGLGFRGTEQWTDENSDYLTSEGKTRKDGHGTRGRWCDVSGMTKNGIAGMMIMSHPENFRHPEPFRIWQKGGIFLGFAPEQLGDWTMEPGKNYVFRYRFYAHDGKIDAADIERIWNDFVEPPKVQVVKVSSDVENKHEKQKK